MLSVKDYKTWRCIMHWLYSIIYRINLIFFFFVLYYVSHCCKSLLNIVRNLNGIFFWCWPAEEKMSLILVKCHSVQISHIHHPLLLVTLVVIKLLENSCQWAMTLIMSFLFYTLLRVFVRLCLTWPSNGTWDFCINSYTKNVIVMLFQIKFWVILFIHH